MNITIDYYPGCDPNEFVSLFGLFVQGVLGTIALCFLIIKRYRENGLIRRSWTVWLLDTSKQVISMVFVHFVNVLWASIVSQRHVADACSLYLLSFLLDSTIGLVIIYILLILVTCLSKRFEVWYTLPGQYDDGADAASGDVRRMLFPWSIQTFLFLLFSALEKVVCLLILSMRVFRDTQIRWFGWLDNAKLELFLTMLVIPLIINIFIFWMTDNFLMFKNMKKYKVSIEAKDDTSAESDQELIIDHHEPNLNRT